MWGPPLAQLQPTRLAFHGDLLAQRTDTELRLWDTSTMTRVDTVSTAYHSTCFLQDGRLAALREVPDSVEPELHLIGANRSIEVLQGPPVHLDRKTTLLQADTAAAVYLAEYDTTAYRYRLRSSIFELTNGVPIRTRTELVGLGDGRLVAPGSRALRVSQPKMPDTAYAVTGSPRLLARADSHRVWYTASNEGERDGDSLALVRLADPAVAEVRIDFAPARVFHLAAGGNAAAAIVDTATDRRIVVVDEHGTERFRAVAPLDAFSFVAISEHRVVMSMHDDTLIAWDAHTGTFVRTAEFDYLGPHRPPLHQR